MKIYNMTRDQFLEVLNEIAPYLSDKVGFDISSAKPTYIVYTMSGMCATYKNHKRTIMINEGFRAAKIAAHVAKHRNKPHYMKVYGAYEVGLDTLQKLGDDWYTRSIIVTEAVIPNFSAGRYMDLLGDALKYSYGGNIPQNMDYRDTNVLKDEKKMEHILDILWDYSDEVELAGRGEWEHVAEMLTSAAELGKIGVHIKILSKDNFYRRSNREDVVGDFSNAYGKIGQLEEI